MFMISKNRVDVSLVGKLYVMKLGKYKVAEEAVAEEKKMNGGVER